MKVYTINGWHYLGFYHEGRLLLVTRLGKCGSRISP